MSVPSGRSHWMRLAVMTLEASAPAMAQTPTPLVAQWREVTRYFAITSKDRQLCRVDRKLRWTGGSLLDLARLIGERQLPQSPSQT